MNISDVKDVLEGYYGKYYTIPPFNLIENGDGSYHFIILPHRNEIKDALAIWDKLRSMFPDEIIHLETFYGVEDTTWNHLIYRMIDNHTTESIEQHVEDFRLLLTVNSLIYRLEYKQIENGTVDQWSDPRHGLVSDKDLGDIGYFG